MSIEFRADRRPAAAEEWLQLIGQTVGPLESRDVPDRFVGGEVGHLRVGELTATGPGRATRGAAHVRRSETDMYKIDVLAWGRGRIEQDGRSAALRPGDFTLVDLARPADWRMADARCVAVVFPPVLLPLGRDDVARLAAVPIAGDCGPGAIASALARQLPRRLDELEGAASARVATAMIDVLTTALAAQDSRDDLVPPDGRRRALLLRVHAFIERHLSDPQLSPAAIADAHFISLRYLHKLFETEEATVAGSIRRRRLEGARRDLLDPVHGAATVGAIAARWGLPDPAHFSRLFRAAYGAPPGEYREALSRRAA
jgi:AraC-like DNA-binding protein